MYNITTNFPLADTNTTGNNTLSIPKRTEIATEAKWNLTKLYANTTDFKQDIVIVNKWIEAIAAYRGTLADPLQLEKCLAQRDAISIKTSRLFAYARMSRDTDANNQIYQANTTKIEALLAETCAATAFIEPELLALPAKQLLAKLQNNSALQTYQFYIEDLLRQSQHILSPIEEELLAKTSELLAAPTNIYTILTNADLKFPETLTESGSKIQLSEGRYNRLIRSTDRNVRQTAFKNLFSTYANYRNTFATTLSFNVKAALFYAKAKKYKSTLTAALDHANIPTAVYDNVITVTQQNLTALHDYVALKKKFLQLEQIHMYDLYVPLTPLAEPTYDYQTGLKLVLDSLKPLGSKYCTDLQRGVSNGWLDIYENQGKRTGAYSWGVFDEHPFVLLNYDNRYGAVSTLAHELGHAMHSYYSNANQAYINADYTIFCAEIASTTNEILLLDHMLEIETDPHKRLYFINQYLEQVRTTVYRQAMFAEFERLTHDTVAAGESLTADRLEKIWLDLNRKYYGEDIVIDDAIKIEWARIPHFYRSFYVYQYVTGYAGATTLVQNLNSTGVAAQERYLHYLKSGGSAYSIDLLKSAGVDMTTTKPLKITLAKFTTRLAELKIFLNN